MFSIVVTVEAGRAHLCTLMAEWFRDSYQKTSSHWERWFEYCMSQGKTRYEQVTFPANYCVPQWLQGLGVPGS